MLSILINAYACSPGMGSEPGMAWNWCANLARYCELHIITEGEFRDKIEAALPTLPQGGNMHFYYNPVSERVRQMCWNQGDWRFYRHYRRWQQKTCDMARKIMAEHYINVIHQLNMIGFREPGYLWEISNVPFVWGPIGGLKQFPDTFLQGADIRMRLFNMLKNTINTYQIKHNRRVDKALKRADLLISSIPDSYNAIKKYKQLDSIIIPETGCFEIKNEEGRIYRDGDTSIKLLWVGKFDFRKQLEIALRTVASLKDFPEITLSICGTGNSKQNARYKQMANTFGISDRIKWYGNVDNREVHQLMRSADLFFFTSVSEDTSTVVLEALSNRLPVLCFDACGFGYVVNNSVGVKIKLSNPPQAVCDFAEKIIFLYNNKNILQKMSDNCMQRQQELSWSYKAEKMYKLYNSLTSNKQ